MFATLQVASEQPNVHAVPLIITWFTEGRGRSVRLVLGRGWAGQGGRARGGRREVGAGSGGMVERGDLTVKAELDSDSAV